VRHDNWNRPLNHSVVQLPVQLDAFTGGGRATGKIARTLLDELNRVASFHEAQGRPEVTITIHRSQAKTLSASFRLPNGRLRFREHPIRVIEDLPKR
jgi:hypothetical protein